MAWPSAWSMLVSWAAAACALMAVAAAAAALTRQPARARGIVELALLGLAVLPLLSLVPVYPRAMIAEPTAPMALVSDPPVKNATEIATPAATSASQPSSENLPHSAPWDPRRAVLLVYATGIAAMAAWSACGLGAVRRVLARSVDAAPAGRHVLRQLAGPASDRVRLVESPVVRQPCAVGWRRCTIVLPVDFAADDPQRLRWALAHEWSHVVRGDLQSWTVASLVGWLYFYQPLYWVLRRQLHVCQDYIADAAAVRAGSQVECVATEDGDMEDCAVEDYAEFLTQAAWRSAQPALGAALGMGGRITDLHRRVVMLVESQAALESVSPRRWNLAAVPLALVAVGLAASLLAGPRLLADEKEPAKDAKKSANRLSYNDGSADGKKSLGGNGEMISFKLPNPEAKVTGIRIHGSRYGLPQPPKEDFMIYFLNEDQSETVATKTAPYSRFKRGPEGWVEIKFPKPIEVPEDFSVALDFRAERTKGVYLSYDSSTDGSHSRIGLPGMESRPAEVGGDWMIEVMLK